VDDRVNDSAKPDMTWVRACDPTVLEEAELVLREVCTQFDLGVDLILIRKWRPMPAHRSPQVGEPDPLGELRFDVLQMLVKRQVLVSFGESLGGQYRVCANEVTARYALSVIVNPEVLSPPTTTATAVAAEPDLAWLGDCDLKIAREARDILTEVKRKIDLDEDPQIISPYPRGTDDMNWGEGYFGPLAEQRWGIVSELVRRRILSDAVHSRPLQIRSDHTTVVEALRLISERLSPPRTITPSAPVQERPPEDPIEQEIRKWP
jgi:hypothetical protein